MHLLLHITRELHTTQFLTMLIQQHHMIARLKLLQNQFPLLLFLLVSRKVLGVLEFRNDDDVEAYVMLHTCSIIINQINEMLIHRLSH